MSATKFSELLALELISPAHAQDYCDQALDPDACRKLIQDAADYYQGSGGTVNITITKPPEVSDRFSDIGGVIGNAIGIAIIIAAVLALIYLIWGGISWITSGGDKTALEGARGRITNAIVGLIVVVAAWAIFQFVLNFLGGSLTNLLSG